MSLKKLSQSSVVLMLVIIVAKLVGMLRDVVLANYFGTSNISDAYLIAVSVPTLLFYFIGQSLSTAYIPMYNKVKAERGENEALQFSNNILTITFCLCTVIVVILLLCPEIVVKIFAAGFDDETTQIAAEIIRISSFSIYLMTVVNILGGYLQANKQFLAPAAISLPRNFAIVVSVIVAASFGVEWLGIGLLAAYILEFLFLFPFAYRKGYRYRFIFKAKDDDIQQTMYMVAPILVGVSLGQINKIIDRSVASTVVSGGVSALSYASIINNAVQEVLVTGIITILFASCAELVVSGKHEEVKKKLSTTLTTLTFLLIPASMGVIILAEPIVSVVLCRGEFDQTSLQMTSSALRCYTLGLLFLAVRDTLVKVFYAYKDTKTTTITSAVAILINIVLNLVLSRIFGICGLALATSISAVFNCITLFILLRRKIGDFGTSIVLDVLWKSVLAALIMGICVYFLYVWCSVTLPQLVGLFITILAGVGIYMLVSLFLRTLPLVQTIKNIKVKIKGVKNEPFQK